MRKIIWEWFRSSIPEGQILSPWLLSVRAILFPLDFFYWRMSMTRGYRLEDDTWLIEGIRFPSHSLSNLSKMDGSLLKVVCKEDGIVKIKVVEDY